MNSKKWTHFFNDKSGSLLILTEIQILSTYFFFLHEQTKTFWFIFQRPWAVSLKITVFCDTCNVSNFFLVDFFTFYFSFWCSLILNGWLVGSLKCHTSPPRSPWGTRRGGGGWGEGGRLYSQETSMKIAKVLFYVH